ncbi:hypothetical protein [Streptomyces sp. NPDC002537]
MKAMVAVSAVVALGLTAGCGSTGGTSRPVRGEGKNELGAVRVPVADPDRLRHVELGAREVPGFRIERAATGAAGSGRPRTDRAPCRPLADALGSEPRPVPLASVASTFAKLGEGVDFDGLMGMVRVSSYGGDGAAATLRGLRTAAASCAGGFRMRTGEGVPQQFSAVRTLDAPELGDEAVAYRLENAAERAPSLITAVRSGGTLAMFFATSLSDPDAVEIPPELVRAQMAKLSVPGGGSPSAAGTAESGEAEDAAGS